MSKFHIPFRNFTSKEIINLICYATREPELLSKVQRVNRLYINSIRMAHEIHMLDHIGQPALFYELVREIKQDLGEIKYLNEDDARFNQVTTKWQDFLRFHFDINGVISENRPYSLNASKYHIYSDEQMLSDPFGYYSKERAVFGQNKPLNSPFASDFPLGDNLWTIEPLERGSLIERNLASMRGV